MAIQRRDFLFGSLAASLMGRAALSQSAFSRFFHHASAPPLTGVHVGSPVRMAHNGGDTWIAAWAGNDNLYSPSNDTDGFNKTCHSNIAFNRLEGNDPFQLRGTSVNCMRDYGAFVERGPDHCTWKSSGCMWLDGALYWVVARHKYGEESGDAYKRQTAQNASIIRSTDFGKTWSRPAKENYDAPMFPGRRFATPYFIQYGYGHRIVNEDNAGNYIYATSNNGFWDCGDDMVLGRVARAKMSRLHGQDWEYFIGGDGMKDAAWSPKMSHAKPILTGKRKFGMTGAVYLPAHRRYFMIAWYYPAGGGKMKDASTHTVWDFYESPRPWGPWTKIGSYNSEPAGWYSPEVCPKFQTGKQVIALTAGNWNDPNSYRLTMVPLELST